MVRLIPHLLALPLRAAVVVATLPTPQAYGEPVHGLAACGAKSLVERQYFGADPARFGPVSWQPTASARALPAVNPGVDR